MLEVIRSLIAGLEAGREMLVCQVVETKGSTPQKAGALMLVDPDGGQVGTLGGGCVEAEVKQKAARLLNGTQRAELHTFILDHDYAWADGLICGGKMAIIAETRRGGHDLAYARTLLDSLVRGEGFVEVAAVDANPERNGELGCRWIFDAAGREIARSRPREPSRQLISDLPRLADRPQPRVHRGVAFLPTLPRIRLVIVGGGHVGQAVAALAAQVDFEVWVTDDRASYVSAERMPQAARRLVGSVEAVLPTLELDERTYVIIVTRGHGHDQEALFHVAETRAAYVGLIGSKRKIRMIFESLREQGIAAAALERVAAPVGFDIGSQTVPEIAVSIVAELIARRNLGCEAVPAKFHSASAQASRP